MSGHYRAPGWFTRNVFNRAVVFSTRHGELTDDEKVPVLRAYLTRWKVEVSPFFDGIGPDSTDEQLRAIAADHPAFEVLPVA